MEVPVKRIDKAGFWVNHEKINIVHDLIERHEINQAKVILVNNDKILLLLYAYKISEFAIRQELRRVFLKTLDEQSVKIEKLIRNFEESFKNAK